MMELIQFFRGGRLFPAKDNPGMKFNAGDGQLPFGILLHVGNRFVLITLDNQALLAGKRQESEHMAT